MTKEEKNESFSQLKKYINDNHLQNNAGLIRFNAEIFIQTTKNKNIFNSEIGVEFSGYNNFGKLTIFDRDNNIDSHLYPIQFSAEWQKYTITNEGNLCISGQHMQIEDIGKYEIILKVQK